MKTSRTFQKQSGFSLLEMMVVMVVLAIMLAVVARMGRTASNSANAQAIGDFVDYTTAVIPQVARLNGNYTGTTETIIAGYGDSEPYTDQTGQNLIIGNRVEVDVVPATTITTDDSLAWTLSSGVTGKICEMVGRRYWDRFDSFSVDGTAVKASRGDVFDSTAATSLQAACTGNANDNYVLSWTVRG